MQKETRNFQHWAGFICMYAVFEKKSAYTRRNEIILSFVTLDYNWLQNFVLDAHSTVQNCYHFHGNLWSNTYKCETTLVWENLTVFMKILINLSSNKI